jgi:hypothetical protein
MKILIAGAIAAGLLTVAAVSAQAQSPGVQMQEKGSVKSSPGASGYAPGRQMQQNGSVKGTTGASGYAPGHGTTGADINTDTDIKAGKSGLSGSTRGNVNVK